MNDLEKLSFWKRVSLVLAFISAGGILNGWQAQDEAIKAMAEREAQEKKAALYAGLISECMNGKDLSDQVRHVDCVVRKP